MDSPKTINKRIKKCNKIIESGEYPVRFGETTMDIADSLLESGILLLPALPMMGAIECFDEAEESKGAVKVLEYCMGSICALVATALASPFLITFGPIALTIDAYCSTRDKINRLRLDKTIEKKEMLEQQLKQLTLEENSPTA